ncbi:MetQ/NlpA family ABC transporter substrate-binding protein [Brevibacillus marinus]|mgnify:CR=1 FL=1|uniref:MetQ/NlpA family ABC transporter substrate-binding protein n=1 Tax=Brevibacillus marinus TaxID=2496837 RepID=UPI0019D04639|nr:MetQ/NlpA family ABC transporter substrate-binding protein [Brevibacillus marinus]
MGRKKWWHAEMVLLLSVLLVACGTSGNGGSASTGAQGAETQQSASASGQQAEGGNKELRVGFAPGPYSDQFRQGVQPVLEKKGYQVTVVEFSDWVQPNFALANQEIDANVYQHTIYLQGFNAQHHLDLTGVVQVPTAQMGIYSRKHQSLEEVQPGFTVVIPNDPANQARALVLLQQAGWLELKKGVDPVRVSERDVEKNLKQIKLEALEAAQAPRALEDADYAVITGNYAVAAGIKLTEALLLEKPIDDHMLVVAVQTENKDQPFVQDIIAAYQSPEFKKFILDDEEYRLYALPDYIQE